MAVVAQFSVELRTLWYRIVLDEINPVSAFNVAVILREVEGMCIYGVHIIKLGTQEK